MEFKRDPTDSSQYSADISTITWNHEVTDEAGELMQVLMQLKKHADQGLYFFFEGMYDADGNKHPDVELEDDLSEKFDELSTLPWDVTGEKIWQWDGAVYALRHFLINMCDFDKEVWTIEYLEECMESIQKGHFETKRVMEELANSSEFEEEALGFLIACMGEMVANGLDDYVTDSWAMTCVLHKKASNLDEGVYWTQERVKKAMEVIKGLLLDDDVVIT